ncbi:unnamed protein product [Adineta ricciae]|uniref:Uncharacterized protein n=1 Tax=Adineta ricciae TaxID=249248 RepID=A0A816F5J2_ADIRI|nr:unnamed protein product [Adineta ricciae]
MIGLGWLPAGSHVESDWIQSGPIPVTYRFLRLQARLEQIKDNKSGEQLMVSSIKSIAVYLLLHEQKIEDIF